MRIVTRRNVEFALLVVFSAVVWWTPLAQTAGLAFANEAYTHIILIIPFSLALAWFDLKTAQPAIEPSRLGGLFLLSGALAIGCLSRWTAALGPPDVRLAIGMLAVVTWWIASVLFCYGVSAFRALVFPLCFLFWLIPLPDFLLNGVIVGLQNGSASAARWLFELARVPVAQEGVLLSLPGLHIEVARECSSIRSSMVLIVTTMVLGHLFLHSWWRKLLLVLIAIPMSIAKNGLRIFVIVQLATRVDPEYLNGNLHRQGGILFLTIAIACVAIPLWLFRRSEVVPSARA